MDGKGNVIQMFLQGECHNNLRITKKGKLGEGGGSGGGEGGGEGETILE